MTIKDLQTEMIAAMKAKEKNRKDTISGLIAAVKKVAIDEGCRDDIPESMVETVILKELKTAKEQVETCPEDRTELLAEYNEKVNIISEFAPKQLSADEIKTIINEKFSDVLASGNKGLDYEIGNGRVKGQSRRQINKPNCG